MEQYAIVRKTAREFAEAEIMPHSKQIDERSIFPKELFRKMGSLGLLGVHLPEEFEGGELDVASLLIILEELSKVSASTGALLSAHTALASSILEKFGSAAIKERYLPSFSKGTRFATLAYTDNITGVSEPYYSLRVSPVDDSYVLNGTKSMVLGGVLSDVFLVIGVMNSQPLLFLLDRASKGLQIGPEIRTLGLRGIGFCKLTFDDCALPQDALVGSLENGSSIIRQISINIRLALSAVSLGLLEAAKSASLAYANSRVQFGKPIGRFEAIQEMIGTMVADAEVARSYLSSLATRVSREKDV